ncbi:uncharacterized protein LOC144490159 [Mustelus asterias]
MATNSLHLTTFCLQYPPPVVACVCIHLACKWSNWEIPVSTDGKNWWEYVDPTVTLELLDGLTHEFLQILEKTPNRLKRIKNWRACQAAKKPRTDGLEDGQQLSGLAPPSSMDSAFSELMSIVASSVSGGGGGGVGSQQPGSSRPWPQLEGETESSETAGASRRTAAGPLRVSLSEYRAKHAEGLAAHKRKAEPGAREENAQSLSEREPKEREPKEREPKERRQRDARHPLPIRIRLPPPATAGEPSEAGEEQLRVRIKVPAEEGSGGGGGRNRERRREPASNHHRHRHHHHHHHRHHHHAATAPHGRHPPSGRREETRQRPAREGEPGAHRLLPPPPRPGKPAKALPGPGPHLPPPSSRFGGGVLDLPFPPAPCSSSSSSSGPSDREANGHGGLAEHSHYQDTFDMLESLLSAQGVPPAPQARFDFPPGAARLPPPLPAEPPPPLPPLPK